jgi:hypothetical protein
MVRLMKKLFELTYQTIDGARGTGSLESFDNIHTFDKLLFDKRASQHGQILLCLYSQFRPVRRLGHKEAK